MRLPSTVGADALASLVVFLVALPLCMGIAIASGAPPAAGLITGIVGGLIVGFIQGSHLQVSGPAAGLAVIVYALIQKYGLAGVSVLVMAAGALQMIAGAVKGGRWFRAVPPSVINGMLGGIGVLIFASQVHVMVDDKPRSSGLQNLLSIPEAVWKGIRPQEDLPHEEAAIVGVLTIVVLLLWNKAPKKLKAVPAPLVGVIAGTLLANLLDFPIAHVNVPDSLFGSVTLPARDTFAILLDPAAWGSSAGLSAARWPGRLELLDGSALGVSRVLLDGAHNPAGAAALARALADLGLRRPAIVFGAMRGKKVRDVLRALAPLRPRFVFTAVDDPNALAADELAALWEDLGGQARTDPDPATAVRRADGDPVVVAGSLYLVGAVRGMITAMSEEE